MDKTTVKQQFRFLPPIVWALLIDATDTVVTTISTLLLTVFGIGLVTDIGWDVVQSVMALLIFEDPTIALLNLDVIIPPPFDIFPTFTARIIVNDYLGGNGILK